jgi:hypothetical protein
MISGKAELAAMLAVGVILWTVTIGETAAQLGLWVPFWR